MLRPSTAPVSEPLALEAWAERAGLALACPFSSSAEFDAALIAARRAAGVYGPKRGRLALTVTAVAGGSPSSSCLLSDRRAKEYAAPRPRRGFAATPR